MDHHENNSWVFDSLVGFLHGPIWNIPLQTFIEEKSLTFEPTDDGEVLERPEYKKIHEKYKNLVDVMLGSFMEDIGITAEQFESACRLSAADLAGLPTHFHRRLFEQIWAANDYDIFVKMMTHKNVELQLQALELIEKRFGTLPGLFSDGEELDTPRSDESDWSDKDDVMTELKKLNLNESEGEANIQVPPEEVVAEKKTLLSKLQSFEKKEELATPPPSSVDSEYKPRDKVEPIKEEAPRKPEVSEAEVKARQQYLQQQRDKLLAAKRQVRARRLGDTDNLKELGGRGEGPSSTRPRSARAAAAVLSGAPPPPPPDVLSARRALANKLKAKVVQKP